MRNWIFAAVAAVALAIPTTAQTNLDPTLTVDTPARPGTMVTATLMHPAANNAVAGIVMGLTTGTLAVTPELTLGIMDPMLIGFGTIVAGQTMSVQVPVPTTSVPNALNGLRVYFQAVVIHSAPTPAGVLVETTSVETTVLTGNHQ